MKLDPHQDIIGRAISGFAQLLIDARDSYVTTTTAGDLFESILRSDGGLDKALLAQLESEGLLTVEVVPGGDGSLTKAVRFTFERYSDHAIASRLLDDHLDESDVHGSFSSGRPLHEVLHGPRNVQAAGVIEAMAIQQPAIPHPALGRPSDHADADTGASSPGPCPRLLIRASSTGWGDGTLALK